VWTNITIYEAKGLEFDDILLYNFFKDSQVNIILLLIVAIVMEDRLWSVEQTLVFAKSIKGFWEEFNHQIKDTGSKGENSCMRSVVVC
jgi:hypothetical protein